MSYRTLLLALFVLVGSAPVLRAQILTGDPASSASQFISTQSGSYYNFSSGSGLDMLVSVWGFVRNPGRYRIPVETNLLDLMSYCGGPNDRGADVYLDRVKVVRRGGADRENEIAEVYEVDIEKYLELRQSPVVTSDLLLFPGDLIIVDGKESRGDMVLRIAQIVVAIASIITSTIAVVNIASK
ncbi:MAG: SLBB domain-containing protein [Bacteroidota bacterium]|nr:SLBB domain-containing protein [Bacteroidota bacterium]